MHILDFRKVDLNEFKTMHRWWKMLIGKGHQNNNKILFLGANKKIQKNLTLCCPILIIQISAPQILYYFIKVLCEKKYQIDTLEL